MTIFTLKDQYSNILAKRLGKGFVTDIKYQLIGKSLGPDVMLRFLLIFPISPIINKKPTVAAPPGGKMSLSFNANLP